MDVVQHRGGGGGGSSSGLNPNAPLFVPRAYKAMDGSSDQWWQLVESSSWFRDYWFRQRQQQEQRRKEEEEEDELRRGSDDVLLPDVDALFHGYQPKEEKRHIRDLAALEGGRWNVPYNKVEDKWYAEKMVHMSDLRVNPWVFQQPK